ncbi:MAG: LrgB family protein, partial [Muribaculaceae bacterium]|nr:LrgB family protein [Muribaculaceae bacterium]
IPVLNPILLTIAAMICILMSAEIKYETYYEGGRYIDFWLKPAVVALGVPLYRQLSSIRKQFIPIIIAELAGCVVGVISVVLISRFLGASDAVVSSLAAKSVTTPIAIEVTKSIGGIPPLAAAVVICVGIFGGMAGFSIMRLSGVRNPMSEALSIGTAAHAIGTTAAIENGGSRYGAWASLGLTLNGLFTALLTPAILSIL